MRTLVALGIHLLVTFLKLLRPGGVRAVAAESILLKHQLLVSQRTRHRAPNLTALDRFLFGLSSLLIPPQRIPKMAVLLKPATLQKFHQALIRRKYRVLFSSDHPRRNPGPKGPVPDVIKLVVDMKRRNPRFGCVRIAQQISNTFGIALDKNVVRRVLAKYYYPGPTGGEGPSWLTFVGQMKDSLWSIDLFRVESALLRSYWVMIILDIYTRLLIGFGVESGSIDGAAACRMFNASIRGPSLPDHISTDHDPLFRFHRWLANLRILDIQEIKAIPFTPVSHPFVERLIGTLRREFLDHALFWNSADLTNKLREFQSYYNSSRVHRGINGTTPNQRAGNLPHSMARLDSYSWQPYCRGLIALPVSI